MSFKFDISESIKNNNEININYTYPTSNVNFNTLLSNITDGYIIMNFVSNTANVTIDRSEQYKSNKLYILRSRNLIKDVSYNSELIIEHTPMTNDSSQFKLFTYFPLNFINDPSNINPTTLNTNSKQIYYTDLSGNKVIIFTTPMQIHADISNITTTMDIFSIPPNNNYNYFYIPINESFTNYIIEPFSLIEGLTQTAYCQPIDMIDPSGATDANLTIPLTGKYTPNDATNNVLRTSINFMTFVLVLGFTYMMSPVIYNDYVIGLIGSSKTGQDKMNRIRSIDLYICFVFILSVFSLILQGIKTNNSASTVIGFLLGIFFVISFVIIQSKKMDPYWFKTIFGSGLPAETLYNNISVLDDFFKFLYDNLMIFLKNILIGGVVFFIIASFAYILGAFSTGGVFKSGDFIIYLSLFTIYITIAITTIRNGPE